MQQLSLLEAVTNTYLESSEPVDNATLYSQVAQRLALSEDEFNQQAVVDGSGIKHRLFYRSCRWAQQSLKQKKLLERVDKGCWELTGNARIKLRSISEGKKVLAMSTSLGICIWSKSENVFDDVIDGPIHLVLSSPPYPLKVQRAYGNVGIQQYNDFLSKILEPILKKMETGASLVLNISNDLFHDGMPSRSTYLERLVITLEDRFGLYLMDRMPWVSNKAPGPIAWASKKRVQLNVGYEHVLWFCNSPNDCFADNRRVLMPHEEAHRKFMENGGLKKKQVNADGNYVKKVGSFGNITPGKIPRNVLQFSNYCHSGRKVSQWAKQHGFPPHAAKMPGDLCQFLIKFLTEPGHTILDPFAGTLTTGESAEKTGRNWICIEMIWEYIRQAFTRFEGASDLWINPKFANAFKTAA